MTASMHLMHEDESVEVSASAYGSSNDNAEPFLALSVRKIVPHHLCDDVTFFVNWKDREDFAEKIYNAIMSLPYPDESDESERSGVQDE